MALFVKWLGALFIISFAVFTARVFSTGVLHSQLCRVNELLGIQCAMAVLSTIIYRRLSSLFLRTSRLRGVSRFILVIFLTMAHGAWLCFYVYLPDNSIIALSSFVCVSVYVHLSAFLVGFFLLEKAFNFLFPSVRNPFFKSKQFHSFLAVVFALTFTMAGIAVTREKPLVRVEEVYIPTLAPDLDGFKVALMTDVHVGPTVSRARVNTIVEVANGLKADMIAIVGDLVDGFIANLDRRAEPLAQLNAPYGKYFATGNHEYYHGDVDKWIDFFRSKLGLHVLRNANHVVRKSPSDAGGTICVVGVDDIITEHLWIQGHRMDADRALAGCPHNNSTIVMLAHQPNAARKIIDASKRHVDLILSGHTHGGQFYIFWPIAYWRNAFLHGLYRDSPSGTQVFVSSGVNYWGPPVKMWNLCEIVVLELRRGPRRGVMSEFEHDPEHLN